MASYTKEEFAQIMAQFEDSGQKITLEDSGQKITLEDSGQKITKITKEGICITAAIRKDIQQNRPLTDTMDEVAYNELKHQNTRLKKRAQEAEGELTIIKGIGNTSPEMKTLQKRVKELENSLSIALGINDTEQRDRKKIYEELDLKQKELDRSNREKNDLFKRISELTK